VSLFGAQERIRQEAEPTSENEFSLVLPYEKRISDLWLESSLTSIVFISTRSQAYNRRNCRSETVLLLHHDKRLALTRGRRRPKLRSTARNAADEKVCQQRVHRAKFVARLDSERGRVVSRLNDPSATRSRFQSARGCRANSNDSGRLQRALH